MADEKFRMYVVLKIGDTEFSISPEDLRVLWRRLNELFADDQLAAVPGWPFAQLVPAPTPAPFPNLPIGTGPQPSREPPIAVYYGCQVIPDGNIPKTFTTTDGGAAWYPGKETEETK